MTQLMIANGFSCISAYFTIASSWTKDPKRTYWYQVAQCLVYAVASYFFGVYAGILMMLINGIRNCFVAMGKYTAKWCAFFCILSFATGMWINGGSLPGYLMIFTTVYYTLFSYILRSPVAVKVNVAVDLSLWFIYDFMVIDVASGIVDAISIVLAIATICRIGKDEKYMKIYNEGIKEVEHELRSEQIPD